MIIKTDIPSLLRPSHWSSHFCQQPPQAPEKRDCISSLELSLTSKQGTSDQIYESHWSMLLTDWTLLNSQNQDLSIFFLKPFLFFCCIMVSFSSIIPFFCFVCTVVTCFLLNDISKYGRQCTKPELTESLSIWWALLYGKSLDIPVCGDSGYHRH